MSEPREDAAVHRQMLVLCALALAASPLLEVRAAGRVGPRGLPGLVLPPTCLARQTLGVGCPGCGLTRSFVHLAHGDPAASFASHRLGWLLMALAALQIPYRLHALYGSGRFLLPAAAARWIGLGLIALLIGNWAVGLLL